MVYPLSRTGGAAPAEKNGCALVQNMDARHLRGWLDRRSLRRPDVGQEGVDFRTQSIGFAAKRLGRVQHLGRRRTGLGGSGRDPDDVAGNLGGAAGGVLDV